MNREREGQNEQRKRGEMNRERERERGKMNREREREREIERGGREYKRLTDRRTNRTAPKDNCKAAIPRR